MTGAPLTVPATLRLATPQALQQGLALLGFEWTPTPFREIPKSAAHGLYAWVIGTGDEGDLLAAPVIYVGIGASKDSGLHGRLRNEIDLAERTNADPDDWFFVHPRAMARLNGKPVGGPVQVAADRDLSWLDDVLARLADQKHQSTAKRQFANLRDWLDADEPTAVDKAERLCVRAAAWLGDCAPPVNSQFASAWPLQDPYEWGGWAAARQLRASAQPPPALEAVAQSAMCGVAGLR